LQHSGSKRIASSGPPPCKGLGAALARVSLIMAGVLGVVLVGFVAILLTDANILFLVSSHAAYWVSQLRERGCDVSRSNCPFSQQDFPPAVSPLKRNAWPPVAQYWQPSSNSH